GRAVSQQGLVHAFHLAVLQQAGTVGHAHQGARRIEQLDQEKHQHYVDDADRQRAHDVELEQGRLDGGRRRDDAVELVAAKEEAGDGDGEDADQDGAWHFQAVKRDDDEETEDGQDGRRLVQIAQRYDGGRVRYHHACAFQGNDRQEQ